VTVENGPRCGGVHLVEVIDQDERGFLRLRLNDIGDMVNRFGQLAHPPLDDLAQLLARAGFEFHPGCQPGKEHVQAAVHIHGRHLARPHNLLGHLPAPVIQLALQGIRDAPAPGLELAIHPAANRE
jgi:hypothetical protein